MILEIISPGGRQRLAGMVVASFSQARCSSFHYDIQELYEREMGWNSSLVDDGNNRRWSGLMVLNAASEEALRWMAWVLLVIVESVSLALW